MVFAKAKQRLEKLVKYVVFAKAKQRLEKLVKYVVFAKAKQRLEKLVKYVPFEGAERENTLLWSKIIVKYVGFRESQAEARKAHKIPAFWTPKSTGRSH